jgi:C4-dicarboxylate-specific signal transduction histidine kinase
MDSIKRISYLSPSTFLVLGVLALATAAYFATPALYVSVRAGAFALVGGLVIILVVREFTERRRMEAAAQSARTLNEELDERVALRTRELETANRRLATEIVDREHATEELRLLAAHLQSAREEERITMAREVHDELGTLMTAIKMDLAYLTKEITNSSRPKSP